MRTARSLGRANSLLDQLQLDVLEIDRKFLVLQPDPPIGKLRVVNVQGFYSVKNYDHMVALSGNLVMIPLVRNELELPVGLSCAYDRAGVVSLWLRPPDLHLVTAAALGSANKHAAIGILGCFEIHVQDKILVTL